MPPGRPCLAPLERQGAGPGGDSHREGGSQLLHQVRAACSAPPSMLRPVQGCAAPAEGGFFFGGVVVDVPSGFGDFSKKFVFSSQE